MGDRRGLVRLSAEEALQESSRSYLRLCALRMTQLGGMLNRVSQKIVVDASNNSADFVHISVFSDPAYCEKSQLLTENLSDAQLLIWLANQFVEERFGGMRVTLRLCNGGGSTLGQTLEALLSSASGHVLCVADSDRVYQDGAVGETAKGAQAALKLSRDSWRADVALVEQRELENLIPLDIRLQFGEKYKPEILDQINNLEKTDRIFSDHFCMKKGDSMCRVFKSLKEKNQHHLIQEYAGRMTSALPEIERCNGCELPERCKASPGLGKTFLALVAREATAGNLRTDVSEWRPELRALVERTVEFGLSHDPVRV